MDANELIGADLDAAVARAFGDPALNIYGFHPSTDWSQGGPIIEWERISLIAHNRGDWDAHPNGKEVSCAASGPTPLIAAMRAFVASKQ